MNDWRKDLQSWESYRIDCAALGAEALLDRVVALAKESERLSDLLMLSRENMIAEHREDATVGAQIKACLAAGWIVVGTKGDKQFRITDTWAKS